MREQGPRIALAILRRAQGVRKVVKASERVVVGDAFVDSELLAQGFQSTPFCFCIAGCDGGATGKFDDAVVHEWLPVAIVDTCFFTAAPFSSLIDHTA